MLSKQFSLLEEKFAIFSDEGAGIKGLNWLPLMETVVKFNEAIFYTSYLTAAAD